MKKSILFFITYITFLTVNAQITEHVDAATFKKLVDEGKGTVLDVRTPREVAGAHIEGTLAINITDPQFVEKVNKINKEKPVYIYCLTGSRSRQAAMYMEKMGFKKIYNLQPGIIAWYKAGYKLVASQNVAQAKKEEINKSIFDKIIQENKVVLVDYYAPWCAPCKKMLPTMDSLENKYTNNLKILKINIDENKEFAKQQNVSSVPTIIVYKNGSIYKKTTGYNSLSDLEKLIE